MFGKQKGIGYRKIPYFYIMDSRPGDFYIEIDFNKETENPARIFQSMANLIYAFETLDVDLLGTIDSKIKPVIALEDVQTGSIRAWFTTLLKGVPDEGIKDLDWKKAIGHYLVKAKWIIIKKLQGRQSITEASVMKEIQSEIFKEAIKTDIKHFPGYAPMSFGKLLTNIDNINKAISVLRSQDGDRAVFQFDEEEAYFNPDFEFTPEDIEDLLTKERIESENTMILKVKKPDYLGSSMWDFKYNNRLIQAKIFDVSWLTNFQNRKVDIRPGDSVRAKVKIIAKYGFDNEIVGTSYNILSIDEILPMQSNDSQRVLME